MDQILFDKSQLMSSKTRGQLLLLDFMKKWTKLQFGLVY